MNIRIGFHKAEKKADVLLNEFVRKLLEAQHAALAAAEHAVKAQAIHEAALLFHHERHAAVSDLHAEAMASVDAVGKVLGDGVEDAVEGAAEGAVKAAEAQ